MVVQIISITPALKLNNLSDSAIITYSQDRIKDVKASLASFPGLVPTPVELQLKLDAYSTARQNQVKGNKSSTINKNKARFALERSLSIQANNCADIADGNLETYVKSGYGFKTKGSAPGPLPAPQNFRVLNGTFSGSIVCKFRGVDNNHGYELSVISEDGSMTRVITNSGSPVTINELAPLKRYVVKCRATGARGYMGEWTPEVTVSVI